VSDTDDGQIKLIDFGVSEIASGLTLDGFVGSIGYIAPELYAFELHGESFTAVISRHSSYHVFLNSGKPVDMWAVGVITYLLLSGCFPFGDVDSAAKHKRKVKAGKFEFPEQYFGRVSSQAKELICGLLCKDVTQRLTVEQAVHHDWVRYY
jgi:serine/threonine protein kinase